MISYTTYKVLHFTGIFVLFVSLAVALGRITFVRPGEFDPWARRLVIIQSTALFLVILGGFGLMSRLGIAHTGIFPGWIWSKLAIWTTVGSLILIPARRRQWAAPALIVLPLLGALAGFFALTKPFL